MSADYDERAFTFAKLKGFENYQEWDRNLTIALAVAALLEYLDSPTDFPPPTVPLLDENGTDIAKLKYYERRTDKYTRYRTNDGRVTRLIFRMVIDTIQQELLAMKSLTEWTAHDLYTYLKTRYTQATAASKWTVGMDLLNLGMSNAKDFDDLRSQYYDIKKRGNDLNMDWNSMCLIKLLNVLGPAYKHYMEILQERLRTDKDLKEDDIFKLCSGSNNRT